MESRGFSRTTAFLCGAVLSAAVLRAQAPAPHVVSAQPPPGLVARRGASLQAPLKLVIRSGYHINSNKPAEEYLIPTVLSWAVEPFTLQGVAYPKPETVKYEFSTQPLLVYSGAIEVVSRFAVPVSATSGPLTLAGKLRYQACTDKMCLPPRTLDVIVPIKIE